ncbi:MAG: 30S ribosomal protein S6 [Polyangiaceae bacterium]|nr:30S ribosomal protein S6 [Polyangiaceae bacterium]
MAEAQALKSREYETIYILRSDVDADTADKVQARVADVVARDNGKLVKVEAWGRRKLAYPVAKQKKGVYVYVKYVGRGGLVAEVERNLKLQDSVLKFQTVQTNDNVDVALVTVDPEEIKFQRLELPVEEEKEESPERALGLLDIGEERRSARGDGGEGGEGGDDEFAGDEAGESDDIGEGDESKEGEESKEGDDEVS